MPITKIEHEDPASVMGKEAQGSEEDELSTGGDEGGEGTGKEGEESAELEAGEEAGDEGEEVNFLDPNELPAELKPAFKRMQASFTRAMQKLSGEREKVAMYDKLMENPQQAVELLAQKVGLSVNKAGKVDPAEQGVEETDTARWIRKIVQDELQPAVNAMKAEQGAFKAQSAISYLDKTYPDWYLYEDIMAEMVKRHPSLRDDLDNLYTLSKSGADKAVMLKKAAAKTEKVVTTSSKGRAGEVIPVKAKTVQEAFDIAKKQLGVK